jgi:PfaB family protein
VLSEHALENQDDDIRLNGFLASSELHLVLVNGEDEAELQQKLLQLASLLLVKKGHDNLKLMAVQQYQQYLTTSTKKYSIALLAESNEELTKEIQLAQQGIKNVFDNLSQAELGKTTSSASTQWKTPKGSYFSADPAATSAENSNNVCFMYPGIGATYVGLGRDLFQLFPEIYTDVANLADDIGSSLKDTLLNPRSLSRLDFKALKQRDLDLRGNLADIAEAGVGFACVFSKIFTKVFKLNADFATGYSMGEVSMYAALGCWQQPGLMSARLANSATFNERLCGDLLTLREHWNLPLSNSKTELTEAPIWETYTIKATLAQVEAACIGETRVYCTIINTPYSVLLAGYPADCLRVIDRLGVRAMALNMANAIHSAPAKAEYENMVALYTMAVNARINTKLYSSSCYLPVPQLSKAIANSIAKCLCDRVDFPRLVNTLYNNGARVFIEMGPGRSLCSWVDKTLEHENKQHEHKHQEVTQVKDGSSKTSVSVPVNAKGVSDELTYFRAIAKLVSHGVKLDLNSLFYGSIVINKNMTNKVMATTEHSANTAHIQH